MLVPGCTANLDDPVNSWRSAEPGRTQTSAGFLVYE